MEEQLVIRLKDTRKRKFLLELLGELDFVEIVKSPNGERDTQPKKKFTPEQQEFVDDLKESLRQVDLHLQGKIELQSADELIKEIWPESKAHLHSSER